jgi:hypothetical protein
MSCSMLRAELIVCALHEEIADQLIVDARFN